MTPLQRWTLAATGLGLFMIFLDALIVNVGLPAIQAEFRVGEAGLQWVVAAYSLGWRCSSCRPQRSPTFTAGAGFTSRASSLFTAASIACGLAPIACGAQRGARRARRRGGDRQRHVARARQRGLSRAQGEGACDRHLGRDRRRGRTRSARRSAAFLDRDRRMAEHLLGQPAGRRRRDRAHAAPRRRVARRASAHARSRRPGTVHGRRSALSRTRSSKDRKRGWTQPAHRRACFAIAAAAFVAFVRLRESNAPTR